MLTLMTPPVCIVSGVGPGTGAALSRRFAEGGYRVAMLARTAERLEQLEREIDGARGMVCDVGDPEAVAEVTERITKEWAPASILVHNAVGGSFGDFLQIEPEDLERNFRVNTMGLLYLARALAPAMIEAGRGVILATGNTSALRGKASFAGFAPTKAAQRILAESMARSLGPKGIHVAYLLIDAVIDVPWTRKRFADQADDFFCKPAAIAETAFHVAHQDRSAWSFLVEVRPFAENW